jgi:tetratricopeptide (TPR) repeat protein
MKHWKGEVIQRFQVQALIPLYEKDVDLKDLVLPQFKKADDHHDPCRRGGGVRELPPTVASVVRKLLARRSMTCDVIVACIHLVVRGEHMELLKGSGGGSSSRRVDEVDRRCNGVSDDDDDTGDAGEEPVEVRASWSTAVKDRLTFNEWQKLVRVVASRIVFVEAPHPLYRYATHQLPNLSVDDRKVALQTLMPLLNDGGKKSASSSSSSLSASVLSTMTQCQDRYSTPRRFGALLHDIEDMQSTFPHSCVPTAWLELVADSSSNEPPTIQETALFDVRDGEQASVCYVSCEDEVEQREADMAVRTGGAACACLRCRYETNGCAPLSIDEQLTLARYYLSKGRWETAQHLYQASLSDAPDQPDAWHALGAIELSQGCFLKAQRTWKEAGNRFPTSCRLHAGMALQMDKARCYRYFDSPSLEASAMSAPLDPPRTPVPNVQVAPLLPPSICEQIWEWASQGQWSQQRHYAVPTNDVPVHTVEPLLEWFNRWFFAEMRAQLARQFNCSPNFFVHDAFCVQYVAGTVSNHLPIHTDESTHSFVIALNDCDNYEGGGTYFPRNDVVVRLKVGEVLSFRGDSVRHGGEAVTKNARHILVAFLYHDDDGMIIESEAGRKRRQNLDEDQRKHRTKEAKKAEFSFQFAL